MLSSTILNKYYYVYILESTKDGKRYVGFTIDIKKRLEEHHMGRNLSTKYRRPFKLIYAELCTNINDAKRREKYLKQTGGRRFLAKRLKEYYKLKNCTTGYA
ncbi:MAG: GIY-YIG nuclease family protein [Patescibacteria group bacterium]